MLNTTRSQILSPMSDPTRLSDCLSSIQYLPFEWCGDQYYYVPEAQAFYDAEKNPCTPGKQRVLSIFLTAQLGNVLREVSIFHGPENYSCPTNG